MLGVGPGPNSQSRTQTPAAEGLPSPPRNPAQALELGPGARPSSHQWPSVTAPPGFLLCAGPSTVSSGTSRTTAGLSAHVHGPALQPPCCTAQVNIPPLLPGQAASLFLTHLKKQTQCLLKTNKNKKNSIHLLSEPSTSTRSGHSFNSRRRLLVSAPSPQWGRAEGSTVSAPVT